MSARREGQVLRLLGTIAGAIEGLMRHGWTDEEIRAEVERDIVDRRADVDDGATRGGGA